MNFIQSRMEVFRNKDIQEMLKAGEDVIRVSTISPGIYWKAIAVFLLSLVLLLTVTNLGIFLLFVSFILFVWAILTQHYLMLVLTNKRVFIRHGILVLDYIQLHHNRIESVELEMTIMGRLLGYSTIMITGTGSRVAAVPFISDGRQFRSAMDEIVYEREERLTGDSPNKKS